MDLRGKGNKRKAEEREYGRTSASSWSADLHERRLSDENTDPVIRTDDVGLCDKI